MTSLFDAEAPPKRDELLFDWERSLRLHIDSLTNMLTHLESMEVHEALNAMRECKGLFIFTGVGQNYILACKIASTFNSLYLRSVSVDPIASLHGTLGLIQNRDLLVPISRSGETEELIRFIKYCRQIGFKNVLGIHSEPMSSLAKLSRLSVYVPITNEADQLNIVPTASSVCFLAFLHSLGVQLSSERKLTVTEFLRNHPGGTLGKNTGDK